MSYILDALKRADAERERGHVPGLHTRNTPELDAPATGAASVGTRHWPVALALLLALSAGVVLMGWLGEAPPASTAAAPEPPTPITVPITAPMSQPQQSSAPPTSVPAALPANPPEPADRSADARDPPPPALPILAPAPPRPPVKATAPAPPPTTEAKRPPDGSPAADSTAPTTPVRSFAELSPEARARLPAVNVSGSTYSKNPALRMLIVNGKVVEEGGEIAPGLTLETIEPRSAVLNHQGLRYRIGY